jgi:hypothetical protein
MGILSEDPWGKDGAADWYEETLDRAVVMGKHLIMWKLKTTGNDAI